MPREFENWSIAQLKARADKFNNPGVSLLMELRNQLSQEFTIKSQEAARNAQKKALKHVEEERAKEAERASTRADLIKKEFDELSTLKNQIDTSYANVMEQNLSLNESRLILAKQQEEMKALTEENNDLIISCDGLFVTLEQLTRDIEDMRNYENIIVPQDAAQANEPDEKQDTSEKDAVEQKTEVDDAKKVESQESPTTTNVSSENDSLSKLDVINNALLQQGNVNQTITQEEFDHLHSMVNGMVTSAKDILGELNRSQENITNIITKNNETFIVNKPSLAQLLQVNQKYRSQFTFLINVSLVFDRVYSLLVQRTALLKAYGLNNQYHQPSEDNQKFDVNLAIYNEIKAKLASSELDVNDIEFDSVLLACKLLVAAAIKSNDNTKSLLPDKILLSDINTATSILFESLLLSVPVSSRCYQTVQAQLAILYLNKNKEKIYDNYDDRLKDLRAALQHGKNAGDIKAYIPQLAKDYLNALATDDIDAAAQQLLISELEAKVENNHYALRISENKYKNALTNLPHSNVLFDIRTKINLLTYHNFIENNFKTNACNKDKNGHYNLSLHVNDLKDLKQDYVFIDIETHEEIGRIYKSNGVIHFLGYGDDIALNIAGELCDNQFIFDNPNADLKINATFNAKDSLDIISHVKQFELNGDIKSSGYINIESKTDVSLGCNANIQAGKHLNISATSLFTQGHLSADSCNISVDHELQLGHHSLINSVNDLSMSSSDLNAYGGKISTDGGLLIACGNRASLHQNAVLSTKSNLMVKSKSLDILDDAALNANQIRLKIEGAVNFKEQTHLFAKDMGVRAKTINNHSSHLSFESAFFHADDKFINAESGAIKTTESLHITGNNFENDGNLEYGKYLQVALYGSFMNGSKAVDNKSNAKINGQDGNIQAHSYEQAGKCDAHNLMIDVDLLQIKDSASLQAQHCLSMAANKCELSGKISAHDLVSHADDVSEINGNIKAGRADLSAINQIILAGHIENESNDENQPATLLMNASSIQCKKTSSIHSTGTFVTEGYEIQDDCTKAVKENCILAAGTYESNGQTTAETLIIEAQKATLNGNYDINVPADNKKPGVIINSQDVAFSKSSNISCNGDVILTTQNGNIGGNIKAHQFNVESRDGINFHDAIRVDQLKVLCDDTITIDGTFEANKTTQSQESPLVQLQAKVLNIKESANIDNPHGDFVVLNQDEINNDGNVHAKTILLKSDTTINDKGKLNAEQCQIEAKDAINQMGEYRFANAHLKTDTVNIQGGITIDNVTGSKAGELLIESTNTHMGAQSVIAAPHGKVAFNNKSDATIDGRIQADKLYLQADTANVNGVTIVNDEYIDVKNLQYHAKTEFSDELTVNADQLNMDAQSAIDGKGTLNLSAHNGQVGHVHADQINLKSDHLPVADALMHRGVYADMHADKTLTLSTQDPLVLNEPIHLTQDANIVAPNIHLTALLQGDKNLGLFAKAGDVRLTSNNVSANGHVVIEAANNFYNDKATIDAKEGLFIHANNTVTNMAGKLNSPQYVQVISEHGDIINQAHQYSIQGPINFDMVQYVPAEMNGGSGEKNEGYGLFVKTPGKVINDASNFNAPGSIYVTADSGIDSVARCNQYQSYHRECDHWPLRDSVTNGYSWQKQLPIFHSFTGANHLITSNGDIYSLSSAFISQNGNYFTAKGNDKNTIKNNIIWKGLLLEDTCYKDSRVLGGLLRDHHKTRDEINIPTENVTYKDTYILALNDVKLLNALIVGPGNLYIRAKNVTISAPILNHSIDHLQRSFGINTPGLSMIPAYSLYQDLRALKNNNSKTQRLANGRTN